jgi:hypothetical protein
MSRRAAACAWLLAFILLTFATSPTNVADAEDKRPVRIAVLGDSDSHSYQDRYSFPPGSQARGGAYHASALQWTEVLIALRPTWLNMGPWGEWGQRRPIAQAIEWLGIASRSPKKEDYQYNMAVSGAVCDDLMEGIFRQTPRLVDLMKPESEAWRNGIVVIRMGINDIGNFPMLKMMAAQPSAPMVLERSANCATRIGEAMKLLRTVQPHLKFVVIGPFNDIDDPFNLKNFNSASEQANLLKGFSHLKEQLRAMATGDPSIHYLDDNDWFRVRWGERDADGKPNYRTVHIPNVIDVTNTVGDEPIHTVMEDGHAGLVWNTLWAQALVNEMNTAWMIGIPSITDTEAADFIKRRLTLSPAVHQTPAAAR